MVHIIVAQPAYDRCERAKTPSSGLEGRSGDLDLLCGLRGPEPRSLSSRVPKCGSESNTRSSEMSPTFPSTWHLLFFLTMMDAAAMCWRLAASRAVPPLVTGPGFGCSGL